MKLAIAVALACAACPAKKQDDAAVAPPTPPTPTVKPAAPMAQPPPPAPVLPPIDPDAASALTCEAILPAALREKYFPGATVAGTKAGGAASAECAIEFAQGHAALAATCTDVIANGMDAMIKIRIDRMHGKRLDAGKGGVITQNDAGSQVMVWDDDSNCQLRFQVPPAVDVKEFAKDVLANLPVK